MIAPTVIVNSSLIILVYPKSSVSVHFLCVEEFVGFVDQTFHISYIITAQGQLHILIGYSRYIGLDSQLFIWIGY